MGFLSARTTIRGTHAVGHVPTCFSWSEPSDWGWVFTLTEMRIDSPQSEKLFFRQSLIDQDLPSLKVGTVRVSDLEESEAIDRDSLVDEKIIWIWSWKGRLFTTTAADLHEADAHHSSFLKWRIPWDSNPEPLG